MAATLPADRGDQATVPAIAAPLPKRHPLAGRWIEGRSGTTPYADELKRQLEIAEQRIADLGELLSDASQKAKDATKRADALEAERATGACADCAGRDRVIAELQQGARDDGKRILDAERERDVAWAEAERLDGALKSFAAAYAHAQAHRELAAEGS
jgi:hypothetical protein